MLVAAGSSKCALVLAVLTLAAGAVASAQQLDPPGRVARVSDVEGSVALQPAGVQDWIAAAANRPLTTGDRLWSEQNSRVELDMGSAAVRLGPTTGFSFFALDDRIAQLQLTTGTLIVRVRDMEADQAYEIDTPNVAVTLLEPGVYRIEVDEAGANTVVKVSEGRAEATGGGQYFGIGAQQQARFSGTGTLSFSGGALAAPDDLDAWASTRERTREESASRSYVPPDMPGTQDLDDHGTWQATADYGYVWAPFVVVAGWTPYGFGHWAWISPWGWTWIDAAPWGFAPFHYGRWVVWNSTWCWLPGPRTARPIYAPALVAWVGVADRRRAAVAQPGVAWFPLGPHEPFRPAYQASLGYTRAVNPGATVAMAANSAGAARYVNANSAAVVSVPEAVFTSGQRIGGHAARVVGDVLASSTLNAAPPALAPQRDSVLGSAPSRALRPPPAALLNRPVVALTPPPRAPVPFERTLSALQANDNRLLTRSELAQLAPPAAAAPVRMLPGSTHPVQRSLAAPTSASADAAAAWRGPPPSSTNGARPGVAAAPFNETPAGSPLARTEHPPHPVTPVVPPGSLPTASPNAPLQPLHAPGTVSALPATAHPPPAAVPAVTHPSMSAPGAHDTH